MKKGYALTLLTAAIALLQVSTSHANAPIIADPGDILIGNLDPATSPGIFVYPDAFSLSDYTTDETPDASIKFSFRMVSGNNIRINGVQGLSALTGLNDPTNPVVISTASTAATNLNKQIQAVTLVTNDGVNRFAEPSNGDSDPFTVTFRNATLNVDNSAPSATTPVGTVDTAVLTLFASDGNTFGQRNLTVYSVRGVNDSRGFKNPTTFSSIDLAQTTNAAQWQGGAASGFGGSVSSGSSGLCMTVPAAGNNLVLWVSPERYFDLVNNTIYRVRAQITMSNPATPPADTIPLLLFTYDNFNASGNGNNYGGFAWILDVDGDAQGIGRASGRNNYDFWFAPNSVATPQWQSGAFAPAADTSNDPRLQFQVNDANANILTQNDAGTICIKSLVISSVNRDLLGGPTVWNPPINTSTHFARANNETAADGTGSINNGLAQANITVATNGDHRITFGPFNPSALNQNQALYPVQWLANSLYRTRVRMHASAAGTDPVDAIFLSMDTTNSELGAQGFTTRSGGGVMVFSASPNTQTATYEVYFFSQNATLSLTPDANRVRPLPFFFNTNNLFGAGTGGNGIVIDSMEVDRLTTGVN